MDTITIGRMRYNKMLALVKWIELSPSWFETGDRFWDKVNEAYRELIGDSKPDSDRYDFCSVEQLNNELYLNVYDTETGNEVTFRFEPVDL